MWTTGSPGPGDLQWPVPLMAGRRGWRRMDGMKWDRAVHHVESLAHTCADMATRPASIFALRVTQLWATGAALGPPRDLEWVDVALCVDLPVDELAWMTQPHGAEHWANATRLAKNPVVAFWRSTHAPVWNHHIERPALVWDDTDGVREDVIAALRAGDGEAVRIGGPTDEEFRVRMEQELAVSFGVLRQCTEEYTRRRWAPGKIQPVADALWRASEGYVDVKAALDARAGRTTTGDVDREHTAQA